jgi:hypothetical protein
MVKARNQVSIVQFMKRIIYHQGNGVCNLLLRDGQETINHAFNAYPGVTKYYTEKHNMVVDRLEKAIKMLSHMIVKIEILNINIVESRFIGNLKKDKSQIRPDIWHWIDKVETSHLIPERIIRLYLVELKISWERIYGDKINHSRINTLENCRRANINKYSRADEILRLYIEYF